MSRKARHVRRRKARHRRRPVRRAATLTVVAVSSAGVLAGAFAGLEQSGLIAQWTRAHLAASAGRQESVRLKPPLPQSGRVRADSPPPSPVPSTPPSRASSPALRLTEAERSRCPAPARACADLTAHVAWLQSGTRVTYGPVRMEPGQPGTPSATPVGTFSVQWKAGPHFVSGEYGDPMPYATFFAPGGVAFHGGSLTRASHGCVHLTVASARYFQDHLPVGAEVITFK